MKNGAAKVFTVTLVASPAKGTGWRWHGPAADARAAAVAFSKELDQAVRAARQVPPGKLQVKDASGTTRLELDYVP